MNVVTVQNVTKGSTYFTLFGHDKTIHKRNYFSDFVVPACLEA